MTFIERYAEFIQTCRGVDGGRNLLPTEQIVKLEYSPRINPDLHPTPREWLIESFDWFVAIQLIPGGSYGPFYRIDGAYFWPEIGNVYGLYTEKKCFFGLKKPLNKEDARRLYNLQPVTELDYVYELTINMPPWPIVDQAYIFVGGVKGGDGYQVNPNRTVVTIIRSMIITGIVTRYEANNDGDYDYNNGIQYRIRNQNRDAVRA